VVVVGLLKIRRALMVCEFQCFVQQNLVCQGIIKGIPLPTAMLNEPQPQ